MLALSSFDVGETKVSLDIAPSASQLAPQWLALEAHADGSFFTSWAWIGCWLSGLNPRSQTLLLRATRQGQVVGLALLVRQWGKRLKVLPSRCLHLHATGDPQVDEITIEHNGLLLHREGRSQIEAAMYACLLRSSERWDQLLLPGLSASPLLDKLLPNNMARREYSHPSFVVDLREVRKRNGDYLGLLSSNTRQQIRRSIKAYEQLGPLTLSEAPDLGTAQSYLAGLRELHDRRWTLKGEPGVFANPFLNDFHARLVSQSFALGSIQLLRVHAGTHDVGYLYSFIHRGRVHFYQSGFDYELLKAHSRPGMVTHTLGVRHNADLGHDTYDLLAGGSQYKTSLSTSRESMVWTAVHRHTLAFGVEEMLRKLKRRWQRARQQGAASAPPQVSPPDKEPEPSPFAAPTKASL